MQERSEATEPYSKYDKIRPHSIRSLQFDQKVRPLSFRPEKFDLFTATPSVRPRLARWEYKRGTRENGDIYETRFMLSIIPTLMVLSFFFNSRILQPGIQQTGPNQFVENQKQNHDNTGRFSMKNCRNVSKLFFAKTSCSHIRRMHARPHRRESQLPLRSLRDLRSRWVFAPVRP